MKILYVLKSLPNSFAGGIQTHTWKLSGQMLRLGHEVTILSAGSLKKKEQRYEMAGRQIVQIPYFPGRRLPMLPMLAEEWAFNFSALKWLLEHASQYDVVHLQGRSGFFFPGRQGDVPVVNTLHGLISIENHRAGRIVGFDPDARLHQKWASRWEANAIYNSDHLIVVSQEMAEQLRIADYKMGPLTPKITQIYNGIDPAPPADGVDTEPGLIVFVGRLYRIKGIFPLVDAMKKVRPSVRLLMVGDGPDRKLLEKAIEVAGLSKRIYLTGSLPSSQVHEWMQRAAFVVAPSFHESHGIVLLEAMSCGKTVVTTDIPGIRESVRHGLNGLMVQPGDSEGLANAIHHLLDHPDEAKRMAEAGKRIVSERFSWEKIAAQTEKVYQRVVFGERFIQRIRKSREEVTSVGYEF